MAFQVNWRPSARDALAELWIQAGNRMEITRASKLIDESLQNDPLRFGESRDGDVRIAFALPLVVIFETFAEDRRVDVLSVKKLS